MEYEIKVQDLEKRITKVETKIEDIKPLENRVSVVETKLDGIKEDIKDIKDFQSKMMIWLIGIMGTTLVSFLVLILNILKNNG